VLTILILVDWPFSSPESTLVAHGSPPADAVVGEAGTFNVGSCTGVSVARGVCVGVSVGGGSVAVGIAACVCAIMVDAAA